MKKLLRKSLAAVVTLAMVLGFGISVSAQTPTYWFDTSNIAPEIQTGEMRALNRSARDMPITGIPGVVVEVAAGAAQPTFMWLSAGHDTPFRPGGVTVPEGGPTNLMGELIGTAGTGFIDPNGAGRTLYTNVELSGKITVVVVAASRENSNPDLGATLPLSYGDQSLVMDIVRGIEYGRTTTFVHTFEAGSGVITIGPFPWDANGAATPDGRVGIQSVAIYEGGLIAPTPAPTAPPTGGTGSGTGTGTTNQNTGDSFTFAYIGIAALLLAAVVYYRRKVSA
jgi:hypothetical protein